MKMLDALKTFAAEESGAVTTDFVVFWGGLLLMAQTVVTDVSQGVVVVAGGIQGALEEIAATNLSVREIQALYTSDSTPSGSSTSTTPGNPGNDKAVGNAGETPNGQDDWGSGSRGRNN